MSNTFMRHTACNICRQRKVRCDGGRPCCHNCAVRGCECTYARPGSQGNSDLHRTVKELNERLKNALERPTGNVGPTILEMIDDLNRETSEILASSSSRASISQPPPIEITAPWPVSPFTASLDTIAGRDAAPEHIPDNVDLTPNSLWAAYPWETPDSSAHILRAQSNELSSALHGTESSQQEPIAAFVRTNPNCTGPSEDEIPQVIINDLNMHATLYRKARRIFDEIEGVDNTTSVVYLQSCILLALYELMHAQFLRARTSTIHALSMAKALGLHKMDRPFSPFPNQETSDAAELEEWRRAFWGLMNLSCYVSVSVGGDTDVSFNFVEVNNLLDYLFGLLILIVIQIATFLPSDASLDMPLAGTGPNLEDSDYIPQRGNTSPTQGLIFSTALLGQCLVHKTKLTQEQNGESSKYNFWMHQYRLTQSLGYISNALAVDSNHIHFIMDPEILSISMNIQAARICLDRAATRGFARSNVSIFPAPNLKDRYIKAAKEIKDIGQQMRHLDLARVSPFIPWAIHVAAQVFVRDLLPADRTKSSNLSAPLGSIDSLQGLLAILSQIKSVNPLAGSIESEIRVQITGVKSSSDDLPVG
ncbi:transcriptional regulator family: Fungal Specific TF [Paecilomyces variotii]|nr:transcriptional regulator family: Fungal Specific TF [Paecilomyces variotii]